MGCHAFEDRECKDEGEFLIEVTSRGDDASMLRTRNCNNILLSPDTFYDQEDIVQTMLHGVRTQLLPHSYIFTFLLSSRTTYTAHMTTNSTNSSQGSKMNTTPYRGRDTPGRGSSPKASDWAPTSRTIFHLIWQGPRPSKRRRRGGGHLGCWVVAAVWVEQLIRKGRRPGSWLRK